MKNTIIEWAHHTVNFWWGCTKVSPACEHCYAEMMAKLFSRGKATWGPSGARWIRHENARRELYKLDKSAHERGVRERIFINSMSDTFEDREDLNEAREMLWGACQFVSNIDILLLTKRPENIRRMVPPAWLENWPAHVWVGTTVETHKWGQRRIPELLAVPAKVRFLSCEPLRGHVHLLKLLPTFSSDEGSSGFTPDQIHWVICGGESGAGAHPLHLDVARGLRDQCKAAGIAFFFKQWGEWKPCVRKDGTISVDTPVGVRSPKNPALYEWDDGSYSARVGKAAAGRELDGVIHNAVPEVVA